MCDRIDGEVEADWSTTEVEERVRQLFEQLAERNNLSISSILNDDPFSDSDRSRLISVRTCKVKKASHQTSVEMETFGDCEDDSTESRYCQTSSSGPVAKATEFPVDSASSIIRRGRMATGGLVMTMSTAVNTTGHFPSIIDHSRQCMVEDVLPKGYLEIFERIDELNINVLDPTHITFNTSEAPHHATLDLLVCNRFRQGRCKLQTCPYAHPGIRDSAVVKVLPINDVKEKDNIDEVKDGDKNNGGNDDIKSDQGKRKPRIYRGKRRKGAESLEHDKKYCVTVCLEALTNATCHKGNNCKCYHPYVRPVAAKIIAALYSKKNRESRKVLPNATELDGSVADNTFQGYGVLEWVTGDIYIGRCHGNLMHGYGVWRSHDGGLEYNGFWKNGKRNGFGMWFDDNSGVNYTGEWLDGGFHGVGRIQNFDGDVYEGRFHRGQYDEVGMLKKMNGFNYCGGIRKNLPCGKGAMFLPSGEKYKGSFVNGAMHGHGICTYRNGGMYKGNLSNGEPEGDGVCLAPGGEKYIGQWRQGRKEGAGVFHFANGDVYTGNFANSMADGVGTYRYAISPSTHFYHGDWKNNMKHGRGSYFWNKTCTIEGSWENDLVVGKGSMVLSSGEIYTGNFLKSKKHGKGTLSMPNGDQYEGDFEENIIQGTGVMHYANGHVYEGSWKSGKKHGCGKLITKQFIYVGDFCNNFRHGHGELIINESSPLEEKYKGDWYDDAMNGFGTYLFSPRKVQKTLNCSVGAPAKYVGDWRGGKHDGFGLLSFQDGSTYRGEFRNGFMCGKGSLTHIDGWVYDGDFLQNKRHGLGMLKEADKTYVGQFLDDRKHGRGECTRRDGNVRRAIWFNGYPVGKGKVIVNEDARG